MYKLSRCFVSATALTLLAIAGVSQSANAQTLTTVHNFAGDPDGAIPAAKVIRDAAGNLFGTTMTGGANDGTVFKIDSQGVETILHTFHGNPDGASPWAGLVGDAKGNLYGTTTYGGPFNFGVVFKIDSSGEETVLYSFAGAPDGASPFSGLVLDSAGNLYGTTLFGGTGSCTAAQYGGNGCGTVFKVSPDGTETILHSFAAGTDGALPVSALLRDSRGNLYGTTEDGGSASNCPGTTIQGCGTVFMLSETGAETILHRFAGNPTDGEAPESAVIIDPGGNLFGTTTAGGAHGWGTVFEITRSGSEKLLYSFGAQPNDGQYPSGLVADPGGNLYGTTQAGGGTGCAGSGCGTLFRVTQGGREITLPFGYGPAGCVPFASLIRDSDGNFYGTTTNCGLGWGTVFELSK